MRQHRWYAPLRRVVIVGGVETILFYSVNLGLVWLLTEADIHYLLATGCGFGVQVTASFFINRKWAFQKPEIKTTPGLIKTWLIGASDLIVALAVTALLVEVLELPVLWARIIAAFFVFAWSYTLNCLITFKVRVFS